MAKRKRTKGQSTI